MMTRAPTTFSVVIPAHDEGTVIRRCLDFVSSLAYGEAEVVVVANGCADRTAEIAAAVPGVTVVELPAVGKSSALNAGDKAVTAFPRVYLDADITVDAEVLRRLAAILDIEAARVAAPRPRFVVRGRPVLVRLFFGCYQRLPYLSEGMVGTGLYAMNAAGRARFDDFPPLTADDLFVQRCFEPEEVLVLEDASFDVQTPRSLRSLLAVRTRIAFGNRQLASTHEERFSRSTTVTARALVRLVADRPTLVPASIVYVAVTLVSRALARRRAAAAWQRDTSSRIAS